MSSFREQERGRTLLEQWKQGVPFSQMVEETGYKVTKIRSLIAEAAGGANEWRKMREARRGEFPVAVPATTSEVTDEFDEAIADAVRNGWPEGTERVEKLAEEMRVTMDKPKSFKRRQRWNEDGDEASWEREQAGRTEIWRTSRRETMRGPVTVEILGTWGGLGHLSVEQLQWDGVVLVVLCRLLEEAGYRVGATLNNASRHGSYGGGLMDMTLVRIPVKLPNMPLDIASIVSIASYPGVFRKHGLEMKTLASFDVNSGFGATQELSTLPPLSVINPRAVQLQHAYSETAARAEIQRVLDLFKDTSIVSTYLP